MVLSFAFIILTAIIMHAESLPYSLHISCSIFIQRNITLDLAYPVYPQVKVLGHILEQMLLVYLKRVSL